jgi:hypothetical protein
MPSKKKSKAKGRKPAADKGGVKKAADNVTANEQKQKGTLNSEMQRLKIGGEKDDKDDEEAMLEEAIKLAAVEEQQMKVKEKENCTHGYNPSSTSEARFCQDFMKTFMESYYNHTSTREGNNQLDKLDSAFHAFTTAITSSMTTNASRNSSNIERIKQCINPYSLAEGTKLFILDGNYDEARLCAVLALRTNNAAADVFGDGQKMLELIDADEHTLVQFFRKQIPCSCLDEKYKEVKSITKMGICYNPECPLPDRKAVRSSMLRCTGCQNSRNVNYCSRECQEADWHVHKQYCGKTYQEIRAMHPHNK